ncbi:hypothetical protein AFLA_000075 [Aspergillus flavus NRRL3357]|nr:hypothetical protein AFLA_000075 [Aspergillus flavus NRRL3357]
MTDANTIQTLDTRLGELLAAIESHPMMTSSQPHPTGFYVHDFIRNTHTKPSHPPQPQTQATHPNPQEHSTPIDKHTLSTHQPKHY